MTAHIALVEQAQEKLKRREERRNGPPHAHGQIHDAASLLLKEVQPVRYVIPGWVPEGLLMLVAPPKFGKSTLALQMAIAKARGGEFWGQSVPKGRVLMIDLETNERRLRRKLEQSGVTDLPKGALLYATEWPRGLPGVERIAETIATNTDICMVVVDTLQRFRDTSASKQNAYAADYDALAPLQQLCRETSGLSIMCAHHKRKAASDDPIDSINGSAAIAGAADAIWIMSRRAGDYVLHVQGRDWERDEDEFRIERSDGQWQLVDGPRFTSNEADVLKHLSLTGGMTAPQLADALGCGRQAAYERLKRMQDKGLVRFQGGAWISSL